MDMFRKKHKGGPNISSTFSDEKTWDLKCHERFQTGVVTAIAYDPLFDVYACGFSNGEIHLYGAPSVHFAWSTQQGEPISHLQISPAARKLVCISNNAMITWDLDGILQDQVVTMMELPKGTMFVSLCTNRALKDPQQDLLSSHWFTNTQVDTPIVPFDAENQQAFIPFPDGTIHLYDLSRLCMSPTKTIPHPEISQDVVMDVAQSRSLDLLLIATTNSIYLWRFSTHNVERLYNLPEKSSFQPVCLALHPKEDIFVSGLADGRLVIWNTTEEEPLWITNVSELIGSPIGDGNVQSSLSPVFKLSWRGTESGSRLTVLGGNYSDEPQLTILEFSSTPFDTLENLVASNCWRHAAPSSQPITDFIDSFSSNILLLTQSGGLETLDFSLEDDTHRDPRVELLIPYQIRSSAKMGRVVDCLVDMPVAFSSVEQRRSVAFGGSAQPHQVSGGPNARLAKYDSPRLLLALCSDGVVRFDNISAHLLVSESSLTGPYPSPLSKALLDTKEVLEDPLTWTFIGDASNIEPCVLEFVPESLEIFVGFNSGEAIVWKWSDGSPHSSAMASKEADNRLLDLSAVKSGEGFLPKLLLNAKAGPAVAFAISGIGFFATAFANNKVLIADMRGPSILHEHISPPDDKVVLLKFAICKTNAKLHPTLHLAALHHSGSTSILPIVNENHTWKVGKTFDVPARKGIPHPTHLFLVDILSGEDLTATPMRLKELLSSTDGKDNSKSSFAGEFYRITISNNSIACHHGWSSQELATVSAPGIVNAGLLQKGGSTSLVTYAVNGGIIVSAIPGLQQIVELQTPFVNGELKSASTLSHSLEFSVLTRRGIEVWSLDNTPRASAPDITLPKLHETPKQSTGLISWLIGSEMSGFDFDGLVAGPNRPEKPTPKAIESTIDAVSSTRDAIAERGEALDNLAAQTAELEKNAGGMAEQAQKLASRQTKRHRFGF